MKKTLLSILLPLALSAAAAQAQFLTPSNPPPSITLAWTPPGGSIAGYRLYYGTASRSYTNMAVIASATNTTITPLVRGVTYYFAVTATDTNGLESVFSNEITYTPPTGPAAPTLRLGAVVIGSGTPGITYTVEKTTDLVAWKTVGSGTAGSDGAFNVVDGEPLGRNAFYRTQ